MRSAPHRSRLEIIVNDERWLLDTTLTIEHHDTHYDLVDVVSGARGTIGPQTVYGIAVGVGYRF